MARYLTDNMRGENPKAFWSYIKKLRQDSPSVEDFRIDNELISNASLKSEILSKQFASIFTKENIENLPNPGMTPMPTIGEIIITVKGVEKQYRGRGGGGARGALAPPFFPKKNNLRLMNDLQARYSENDF